MLTAQETSQPQLSIMRQEPLPEQLMIMPQVLSRSRFQQELMEVLEPSEWQESQPKAVLTPSHGDRH